jgi:hypothetical protein
MVMWNVRFRDCLPCGWSLVMVGSWQKRLNRFFRQVVVVRLAIVCVCAWTKKDIAFKVGGGKVNKKDVSRWLFWKVDWF